MSLDPSSPILRRLDPRGVATLTFNRPEVNNAYNGELIAAALGAIDALARETALRVVMLRGAGKHFQAGADLKWISSLAAGSAEANLAASRDTASVVRRLNEVPVPTVALVQGACFGGGTGIVAACDIVIAADNALFSIAETRWGLTGAIILPQLADAIGVRQVRRYAQSGERFDAQEARRIGLVHEVVALAELDAAGERAVDHLLQNAPDANRQTKAAALEFAWGKTSNKTFAGLIAQHAAKRRSEEAAEGLASFAEKRPARWYSRKDDAGH
jgi:methylglutaconyl-CoA hydratase